MKKITLILAFIGMISLGSCTVNEDNVDNDTIGRVFEYSNVNFLPSTFSVVLNFPEAIFNSDMVLVYRLSGNFQGEDVWRPLPQAFYFDDGTLDFRYDFDFTRFDAEVYLEGFDLDGINASFRLNQVFRVVVIPAAFGKTATPVDLNDYKAVIAYYGIDENRIKKMN